MKFNIRTEVKWNRREIEKIERELVEDVLAERVREAQALECEKHGERATIAPTGRGERAAQRRPCNRESPADRKPTRRRGPSP